MCSKKLKKTEKPKNLLLKWDEWLSRKLFGLVNFRFVFLIIEWTAHGIPWLIGSTLAAVISIRQTWEKTEQLKCAVLLFSILIDLVFVGLIKILVQRKRPSCNLDDQIYEAPIADKFSFPSGHSSRAAMLSVLAINFFAKNGNEIFVCFTVSLFSLSLAFSRILMGRHYVSDVIAGLILGIGEGILSLNLPIDLFSQFARLVNYVFDYLL